MRPNKYTMSAKPQYFHYTPEYRIKEIIESGEIKLAEPSVKAPNEKACAWVSTNPFWEHTATKGKANDKGDYQHLTFQEHKDWLGCARIEVKAVGLNAWSKVKHLANMDLTFAKQMEVTGVHMGGNPLEWYGSLKPIKKENWIKIEVLKEGQWIEYNPNNDEAKAQGLTFVSVILPAPNEGQMALLLFTKNELEQLVNSHNENSKNNLNPANGFYSMWQESDAYHDIDLNPHRLTGVLTQEQYDILVKPKYEELQAYRKQAQK
ncbi:hypothetical protein ACM55H_13200 [Flavobacterium sp. ZT3R17]|uniref:hypothetical protein n=1 Tax=Flavobacterium cryoconiti TaxID=3398736 RepID=UPI003A85B9E4